MLKLIWTASPAGAPDDPDYAAAVDHLKVAGDCDVINIASRVDSVLTLGAEQLCHPVRGNNSLAAYVIGREGLGGNPRGLDLQLDAQNLVAWGGAEWGCVPGHCVGGKPNSQFWRDEPLGLLHERWQSSFCARPADRKWADRGWTQCVPIPKFVIMIKCRKRNMRLMFSVTCLSPGCASAPAIHAEPRKGRPQNRLHEQGWTA